MEANRWRQIEELYHSALARLPELRSEFLAQACAGDPDLLRDVQKLLAHDLDPSSLLDRPAWEYASGTINIPELRKGHQLGPYRIDGMLGSGGMGSVYRAEDTRLGRTVAIKVLQIVAASSILRFRREAQAISLLNHPHICALYDVGTIGDTSYLVMEFVEGPTLADLLRKGPLPIDRAVQLAVDIADALVAAHAKGIIHRDLKPGNVIATDAGAKVLDFGIAKTTVSQSRGAVDTRTMAAPITVEGAVVGTPAYMAPEQFTGSNVDPRSDIFSAGLVFYEMLTGKHAFASSSGPEAVRAVLRDSPVSPGSTNREISPELDRIILKCLQRAPEQRYQSAKELERDLKELASARLTPTRRFSRRSILITAAGIALPAGVWVWSFMPQRRSGRIESLAVLPLDNLSGDASQDYFADGMTEVLITDLGKIRSLRVISRPSVIRFKGSRSALLDIAKELNVDALIVGSVARDQGKVRITTQLYNASQDRQLWAETYERDMREVIALQREVAHAITSAISVKATPQETARLAKTRAVNPDAYEGYLRGVLLYGRHSNVDNQAAIAIMEHALQLDPSFAAGQALLGLAYVERFYTFAPEEQKVLEEKAYVAVEKAISLDPDESMAYFGRGRFLWTPSNRFPHEAAIRAYLRALGLNPNLAEARAQLALTYNHVGLLDEAMAEARSAASVNPVDSLPRVVMGQALLYGGQFERALALWSSNPPDAYASVTASHTAWTLLQMGRREEAAARLTEFLAKSPRDVGALGVRAVLLASSGMSSEAEAVIKGIAGQKGFGHFHHTAYYIACAYANMRKSDMALEWLREAAESGFPCYPLFERDPSLQGLHSDPRWSSLMAEMERNSERYRKLTSGQI
jgi:serine/threonine protein kinase/tetratricopeptide (TPR) repeat protein